MVHARLRVCRVAYLGRVKQIRRLGTMKAIESAGNALDAAIVAHRVSQTRATYAAQCACVVELVKLGKSAGEGNKG